MNTNTSPCYSAASTLSLYQSPGGRGHLLPEGWHNPTMGKGILGFPFCLSRVIYTAFATARQPQTLPIQLPPGWIYSLAQISWWTGLCTLGLQRFPTPECYSPVPNPTMAPAPRSAKTLVPAPSCTQRLPALALRAVPSRPGSSQALGMWIFVTIGIHTHFPNAAHSIVSYGADLPAWFYPFICFSNTNVTTCSEESAFDVLSGPKTSVQLPLTPSTHQHGKVISEL